MKNIIRISFLLIIALSIAPGKPGYGSWSGSSPEMIPYQQSAAKPILILTNTSNPFSQYYAEILRNEGLNEFDILDISQASSSVLTSYDLILLGEMPLTDNQAAMIEDWVTAGGNLIAMRPDHRLAGLLGLTSLSTTLSDAYLLIDASGPGSGIVNQTIQFHGTADLYSPAGATSLATLYSSATTSTTSPAVSIRPVGDNNGRAAAFAYDLARSVIYTHQGNPQWAGTVRNPWVNYYVALDLFYPDWIDFNKITIPQADEQQRFLANLILTMNLDKKPLPRFWYFPHGEKAVVVLTGDDHNGFHGNTYSGDTIAFFENQKAKSPAGCSVEDWECIRSSSYIYVDNPMTDAQAADYTSQGFEVGIHVNAARNQASWCAGWSASSLPMEYQNQLNGFYAKYSSIPMQVSERSHCYSWFSYADQPIVQASHGIRLDTNIPYWPGRWYDRRPGYMIGSAMPMRFTSNNGTLIDVYLGHTIISDDTTRRVRDIDTFINSLIDWATGPEGYYGVFTVLAHSDNYYGDSYRVADQIIDTAIARSIPVISGRQLVEWLDARNASTFQSISWDGSQLTFQINANQDANGLQALLPANSSSGQITGVIRDGLPVTYSHQVIKGIEYAIFDGLTGTYTANYSFTPATATPTSQYTATQTSVPTVTSTPTATVPPSPSATPTVTFTPSPTSSPTASPTPTATSPADQIFADGFESGNVSAWSASATDGGDLHASTGAAIVGSYGMSAVVNDNKAIYVTDENPNNEIHYRAGFYFDPNSISMAETDLYTILVGYSSDAIMNLRMEVRYSNGNYQLRARLRNDGTGWVSTNYFNLNDAPNLIELEFWAATPYEANGRLSLWANSNPVADLSGIDNDTRNITRISLGLPTGATNGTRGELFFDAFESGR